MYIYVHRYVCIYKYIYICIYLCILSWYRSEIDADSHEGALILLWRMAQQGYLWNLGVCLCV